jgi:hypothetical protein
MSRPQTTPERPAQKRWNGPSTAWFVLMVGTWSAFAIAAIWNPDTLHDLWSWGQRLPLVAEIGLWIGTLPWMLGLAVYETAWANWLQVVLIAALAFAWSVFSLPRTPKSPGSAPQRGARRPEPQPAAK